ncbi:hypothetical protein BO78DRAFT_422531 [Aspergillus sclerotiicarbonarius CBS 121057]|uniref:Zn(2)-C6 fungal-type domain-containing protein n=1 Tax=Aspergillus sclerotiicarbonarius (strain CBS 121057 / IBT 28362) TaxID=1448318 RepID=A0A319DXH3_ASPSB|nr:hypothetical protein BO78DRAFT_422531 [Aspergillus sclerotiicarbonarius CBS 121057]
MPDPPLRGPPRSRRLRFACDACHNAKTRCTGGDPCQKCEAADIACQYSYTAKLGKPKGSRNKRTLAKLNALDRGRSDPVRPSDAPRDDHVATIPSSPVAPWNLFLPLFNELDYPGADLLLDWDDPAYPPPPDGGLCQTALFNTITDGGISAALAGQSNPASTLVSTPLDPIKPSSDPTQDTAVESSTSEAKPVSERTRASQIPLSAGANRAGIDHSVSNSTPMLGTVWDAPSEAASCSCLRLLTEQLCLLNLTERKHITISSDRILSRASAILNCSDSALACAFCRLDTTVLQLVTTTLQTIFHWAKMDYRQDSAQHRLPPIHFGDWRVPEQDSHLVKLLLTHRVLSLGHSVVKILGLRVDEIQLLARKQMRYQFMDMENMRHAVKSLSSSLTDLLDIVRRWSRGKQLALDSLLSQHGTDPNALSSEWESE